MAARLPDRRLGTGARIRRMRSEDLEEVLRIERSSFTVPWSERSFRGLLARSNAILLVAEEPRTEGAAMESGGPTGRRPAAVSDSPGGGAVLGYAVVWLAGREAELGDLAVRAEARRCGVGTALLRAALEATGRAGAAAVVLEVRRSNEAARRLYERAGFEVVEKRRGYYTRPVEDALVMRRTLESDR